MLIIANKLHYFHTATCSRLLSGIAAAFRSVCANWVLLYIAVYCFCSFKEINRENYVTTVQDSILIQLGNKNNNESYFIIKNLHKNRLVLIDTTNIEHQLVNDNGEKLLAIFTHEQDNKVSAITSLGNNEMITVSKKHPFSFKNMELNLRIATTNGKTIFIYDKELNDTILDYKELKTIQIYLTNK